MRRLTSTRAVVSLPPPETESGTTGYFTGERLEAGIDATWMTTNWLNRVQEELQAAQALAGSAAAAAPHGLADALFVASQAENLLINGSFDLWRIGTTFSSAALYAAGWTVPPWTVAAVGEDWTLTRGLFPPGQTEVPGNPRYYARLATQGTVIAGGNYTALRSDTLLAPDADLFALGGIATVVFWARAAAPSAIVVAVVRTHGTDSIVEASAAVPLTTAWTRHALTVTATPGADLGWVIANTRVALRFYVSGGSDLGATLGAYPGNQDVTVDFARVFLVPGPGAFTPPRRLATESALLATRFQASFDDGVFPASAAGLNGALRYAATDAQNAARARTQVRFNPPLRSTPTISRFVPVGTTGVGWNVTRSLSSSGQANVALSSAGVGGGVGHAAGTQPNDEMAYHWAMRA